MRQVVLFLMGCLWLGSGIQAQVLPGQSATNSSQTPARDPLDGICKTRPELDYETYRQCMKRYEKAGAEIRRGLGSVVFRVTAHRLLPNSCIGGAPTIEEIEADINYTNTWFENEGFNVILDLINVHDICNTYWYNHGNYSAQDVAIINNQHGFNGRLNIFYVDDGSWCPTFPWDTNVEDIDNVLMHDKDHAGWGWTVAHEFGHWLGLLHTFQGSERVTRDPLNSCYDCETDGDYLCATKADYGTYWCDQGSDGCDCTGDYDEPDCSNGGYQITTPMTDACGETFDPPVMNLMAYGCRPCAHNLNQAQVDRMWTFITPRLLQSSIQHPNCDNTITIGGTRTRGMRFEANNWIECSTNFLSYQYTLLDAGNRVDLNPGFKAVLYYDGESLKNPNIEVVIDGCHGDYQFNPPADVIKE